MAVISRMSNEEPIVGKLFFQCTCGEEDHHSMKRCLLVGRVMLKYRIFGSKICSDCHEMMFSVKTSRRYTSFRWFVVVVFAGCRSKSSGCTLYQVHLLLYNNILLIRIKSRESMQRGKDDRKRHYICDGGGRKS
jgi:hypothetical protein